MRPGHHRPRCPLATSSTLDTEHMTQHTAATQYFVRRANPTSGLQTRRLADLQHAHGYMPRLRIHAQYLDTYPILVLYTAGTAALSDTHQVPFLRCPPPVCQSFSPTSPRPRYPDWAQDCRSVAPPRASLPRKPRLPICRSLLIFSLPASSLEIGNTRRASAPHAAAALAKSKQRHFRPAM